MHDGRVGGLKPPSESPMRWMRCTGSAIDTDWSAPVVPSSAQSAACHDYPEHARANTQQPDISRRSHHRQHARYDRSPCRPCNTQQPNISRRSHHRQPRYLAKKRPTTASWPMTHPMPLAFCPRWPCSVRAAQAAKVTSLIFDIVVVFEVIRVAASHHTPVCAHVCVSNTHPRQVGQ